MSMNTVGLGAMPVEAILINRAIREIDDRLFFQENRETGDWCVYMTLERPRDPVAIVGFPFMPPTELVVRWLQKNDTQNFKRDLLSEINKSNEKRKQDNADRFRDEINEGSEKIAWALKGTQTRKFK